MTKTDDAGSGSTMRKKKGPASPPEEPPVVTLVAPKDGVGSTVEERKVSPNSEEQKMTHEKKRRKTEKLKPEDARIESREYDSPESAGNLPGKGKVSKKKKFSTRSGTTERSELSGGHGGEGSTAGTATGESETNATAESEMKDKWDKHWSSRVLTDNSSSYQLNLKRYNDMMAQIAVNDDDYSFVYGLRRYHSEPSFGRDLEERIDLRPGSPMADKCASMEDLIMSQPCYPELMTEHRVEEVDSRQYIVSSEMIVEWNALFEMEMTRFSFFDELFAQGCIVDSMEVPVRDDNIEYLVEAEPADFRNKVDYARLVFKTKHVFTGNMADWYFTGEGRYCWVDGTTYQGEFKNGVMHGDGVILWTDGSIYQGEFTEGIRNGYGIYSTAEGYTYAGDWYHGLPQGKGRMWYDPTVDDSDYYDGEWKECVPHGFGTRQYINGDRYVGNYENGVRSGHGTMIWLEERQVYKGDWLNGLPHGNGTHTWYLSRTSGSDFPTRHVYKGEWLEGTRHGVGRQIYACGSIYEGRWVRGQRHGKGVFVNPAGEVIFGLFRLGSIAGGSDVPLHAPTYACKFDNLIRSISKTIYITPGTEVFQEMGLHETVIRYLPHIRRLFKRAGYLGESWGNQGHYPKWLQKPLPEAHHSKAPLDSHIRKHNLAEVDHHDVHGHKAHRGSPDNVHPLTRFGLWLFMKDCPGVLTDVTLAEFDRAWNAVASISFQTKHNPFEPVYLHQFLQCLVIMAQIIYFEVPKKKERKRARKLTSNTILEDIPLISPADSYTKIKTSKTSLLDGDAEEEGEGDEEEAIEEEGEHEEEISKPEKALSTKAGSVKTTTAKKGPVVKGKAVPPVKPVDAKAKLKKDVPGAKKPLPFGPKGLKKGVLGKKAPKAESAPPVLQTEMAGEDAEEVHEEEAGELEDEGEQENLEAEGEGYEEEMLAKSVDRQSLSIVSAKKSRMRLNKEGKGKKLGEKASKKQLIADKAGKRRRETEVSTSSGGKDKDKPEIEQDRKSEPKPESEEGGRKKTKSTSKIRGKGDKEKKTKKAGSVKNAKLKRPSIVVKTGSAESEEQLDGEEEEHGEFEEEPEARKNSAESQPGEVEPPRRPSKPASEKNKKTPVVSEAAPSEHEPHKSDHESHHKGKRRGSTGKSTVTTKKSKHRANSTSSTKSKYKKNSKKSLQGDPTLAEPLNNNNAAEAEEEEEEEHEEEEEETELDNGKPEEQPRKSIEPKFWTDSEVQLNTEERMYGWTGANKAKCKKHLQKQAAKHKIVVPGAHDVKIAELFERLLTDILLPCLERAPGMYLPEVPDPLPPLADLYYTFSNTYGNREVINAMDFTQSMLPHLLYPHKSDAIFWTRTKDVQSPQIDLDWVLNYFKLHATDPEETVLGEDFLGERLANTKIFSEEIKENVRSSFQKDKPQPRKSFQQEKARGSIDIVGPGNTVFGDDVDGASVLLDYPPIKTPPEGSSNSLNRTDSLEEIDTEFPFSERDLAPEPFLWDRETKCLHVAKKEAAFHNLSAEDIMKVLRQLYPEIIGRAAETNMGFELSFCDWLWASAMVAKQSADRAFYSSMKHKSKLEHLHRPHHHPNHFGFHPNEAPAGRDKGNVFRHQSTLTNLREKYTRSDLHKSELTSKTELVQNDAQSLKYSQ